MKPNLLSRNHRCQRKPVAIGLTNMQTSSDKISSKTTLKIVNWSTGRWTLVIGPLQSASRHMPRRLGAFSAFLSLLLLGCHSPEKEAEAPSAPQVQGEKVLFPKDSPQLAALAVEAAEVCKGSASRLNGRLVWDDDLTVRVFIPFAGRVTKILAEVGQTVL